jgi:hypothetical protein
MLKLYICPEATSSRLSLGVSLGEYSGTKPFQCLHLCVPKIISLSTLAWTWPNPNLSGVKAPKNCEVSCKVIDRVLMAHWICVGKYIYENVRIALLNLRETRLLSQSDSSYN